MMNKTMNTRRSLMALLLAPALVQAQVDTSGWACESCPFDDGYRAKVDAGATNVSDEAARFGNYTGYDEDGAYANLDAQGRYNGDGYRVDYLIEDMGLDSRVFEMSVGSEGIFEVNFGYRELPFRRFDTSSTVFDQVSSDTLAMQPGWVPASTTDGMTELSSTLERRDIGTDRQIVDIGGKWHPADAFRVFANFRRQTRDGIDITSAGTYTQASFLPRWIDYETDQVDAGVRYATDRLSLTVAYFGSFFTNENPSLTWETPFLARPEDSILRMAREPDNDFQQVSVSGKYRMDTWDTVVAALVAIGQGEQDEALLPYTINPSITTEPLPTESLDGEVDTANYSLTVTSRPIDKLRVKFRYRYDERDNKTQVWEWSRVITDVIGGGELEQNVPYSYERQFATLSGEYQLLDGLRVSGGYERKEMDRDYQEVAEQTTDLGWGQIRWQPLDWLDVRVKGGASIREIDRYNDEIAVSLGQNPLMRKYNLAYRDREFGEVVASITPLESPVSFSVSGLFADDEYEESYIGINASEEIRATADVSWAINEDAAVYLIYGYDKVDGHQTGSEQFDFWDWSAFHEDTFDHIGAGLSWRPTEGKFSLRVDYNHGSGDTSISLNSVSGGLSHLPDLESTLNSARVEASYDFSERLSGTFSLRYEDFEIEDWALVSHTTLPTILTMGAEPYDYDVYAVGFGIRYRFGNDEITLVD